MYSRLPNLLSKDWVARVTAGREFTDRIALPEYLTTPWLQSVPPLPSSPPVARGSRKVRSLATSYGVAGGDERAVIESEASGDFLLSLAALSTTAREARRLPT